MSPTRALTNDERELNRCAAISTTCDKPAKYSVNGDGACRAHLAQLVDWWLIHRQPATVKTWEFLRPSETLDG